MAGHRARFEEMILQDGRLMRMLRAVRKINPPDWYIAGGAIRTTVWDALHGYKRKTPFVDVDVVYQDPNYMDPRMDKALESRLTRLLAGVDWEVTNQARAHLFSFVKSPRKKAVSACDGISYFNETATCVGVRLERDGSLTICAPAPGGLKDLMNGIVRPNPKTLPGEYETHLERVRAKRWREKWPRLKFTEAKAL